MSFTITCNNCGEETTFLREKVGNKIKSTSTNDIVQINVYSVDFEYQIYCNKCEQIIDFGME